MNPALRVVVGVIRNAQGEVLIAQRPVGVHQGGYWEFPGGKVEVGESGRQALVRELQEELGIEVEKAQPGIQICHHYPKRKIRLEVWEVESYRGCPEGREGQLVKWLLPNRLPEYQFPKANQSIIQALRLPQKYLITGELVQDQKVFLKRLEHCLQQGIRLVQLRVPSLSAAAYLELAHNSQILCKRYGAELLLNTDPKIIRSLEQQKVGIHLNSQRLLALDKRPLGKDRWLGASCHNRLELQHALKVGVDFVVLSPVKATPTHPEATPIGWQNFAKLCQHAALPVYALAGVGPEDLNQARQAGAHGVAAIRGFWGK